MRLCLVHFAPFPVSINLQRVMLMPVHNPLKHNLTLLNHGTYRSPESLEMKSQNKRPISVRGCQKVARQAYGTWSKSGKSLGLAIQQSREANP